MSLVEVIDVGCHNLPSSKLIVLLFHAFAQVLMIMLYQVYNSTYNSCRYSELLGDFLVTLMEYNRHMSDLNLIIEL